MHVLLPAGACGDGFPLTSPSMRLHRIVDSPNGPLLVPPLVERADISPKSLVQILDSVQLLDNGSTEVDSEVGAVVVALGMPAAFITLLFARLLAVRFRGRESAHGVQVEEALGRRRDSGTWLERLVRCSRRKGRGCCYEQQAIQYVYHGGECLRTAQWERYSVGDG